MIKILGEKVDVNFFPDNTQRINFHPNFELTNTITIRWQYESDIECMTLYYIINHLREYKKDIILSLALDYFPNGRMDRVKLSEEVFTLKWFAKFINDLNFNSVSVFDPHSNVSNALFLSSVVVSLFAIVSFNLFIIFSNSGISSLGTPKTTAICFAVIIFSFQLSDIKIEDPVFKLSPLSDLLFLEY